MDWDSMICEEMRAWLSENGVQTHFELSDCDGNALSEAKQSELQARLKASAAQKTRLLRSAALGELSAGMAHEVRNILTGIVGLCQVQLHDSSQQQAKLLQGEARRCLDLLEHYLQFSKADDGSVALTSAEAILAPVVTLLRGEAKTRGIGLSFQVDEGLPDFLCNPGSLRQVLLNLGFNALQASPEGEAVYFVADRQGPDVCLSVIDNGEGIDESVLGREFEAFVTTRAQQGGTGLGLATSKRLVEDMGGTVAGKNRDEGGACFSVRLKMAQVAMASRKVRGGEGS